MNNKGKRKRRPRNLFTPQEDALLKELVETHGTKNWHAIALLMQTRSSRQCHERYQSYLDPALQNNPWSEEEDARLRELVAEHGHKWVVIARHLQGRSDNNVKLRWQKISHSSSQSATTTPPSASEPSEDGDSFFFGPDNSTECDNGWTRVQDE